MSGKRSFSQKIMSLQKWLWGPLGIIISCAIGIGALFYILRNVIFQPGLAPGSDVTSFAHTTKYIVDYLIQNHHPPPVDLSWYAGFELWAAPAMVYWYLGIIYLITHNLELSTRILHLVALIIVFLVMFFVMKKEKAPTINALIAALVYTFIPENLMSIQSWTKLISLFLLPVLFYFTNQVLRNPKNQYKNIAFMAFFMGLTVFSHPMNAVVYACSLVFYAVIAGFLDQKISFRKILIVILGLGLGLAFAASYLVPFILTPPGETFTKSALWEFSGIVNPEQIFQLKSLISLLGGWIVVLVVPIIALFRARNSKITALYLTGILAMLIAIAYVYLPLGALFPFKFSYSYVWVYTTCFALAYVYGMAVPTKQTDKLSYYFGRLILGLGLIALFFLLIYKIPNIRNINSRTSLPGEVKLAKQLATYPNSGRLLQSHYPLGNLEWSLGLYSGKNDVEGHYYGVSQAGRQIALINDAIHNQYPDYVIKKLNNLNVRYFIANKVLWELKDPRNKELIGQKMIDKLKEASYQLIYKIDLFEGLPSSSKFSQSVDNVYYLNKPSTYVQPVEENVLVIGKYGPTLAAAVSPLKINMLEADSPYLDDYDLDFLKRFDTIFLYGFGYKDKSKAEQLAKDYVKQGGNLIVELFGMENSKLEENPKFLGVTGYPVKIKSSKSIETENKVKDLLPATFEIPGEIMDIRSDAILSYNPMKEWNALEYLNLDQSFARFFSEDDFFSILGYKNIEQNKVIFVGGNIFYHLYNTHNPQELKLLENIINNFNEKNIRINDRSLNSMKANGFKAEEQKLQSDYWKFNISSDSDQIVLISLAYSNNWKAYIDSKPVKVYKTEDLMVVKMPAGKHTLEMKYKNTSIRIAGKAVSVLTLIFLIGLLIYNRRHRLGQPKAN